jgi:hypothetical protein
MPVIPATLEAAIGGWWSEMNWNKMIVETPSQWKSWAWWSTPVISANGGWADGTAQVIQWLSSKWEALCSNATTIKTYLLNKLSSTAWERLKGAPGTRSKSVLPFTKEQTLMPWGWVLHEATWPLEEPGANLFHRHWQTAKKTPMETRVGTVDVGSPWRVYSKADQEKIHSKC